MSGARQAGRGGSTLELLHVGFSLSDPTARWVTIRTPPINPAFALVEAIWILSGRQDSALPTFWNPVLPRFAGYGETFHGAYGWRLRNHFGLDQLARAVQALRSKPSTRQIVLQIWDPKIDFPLPSGEEVAMDVPCNTSSYLKVRDGRLDWLQMMRSNDVFRGTPHNLVQFTILHEMMAGWLQLEMGSFNLIVDSFHVYDEKLEEVRTSVESGRRAVGDPPRFSVTESEWTGAANEIEAILASIQGARDSADLEGSLDRIALLPADWPSALAVIVADAGRRKRWDASIAAAEQHCSNSLLLALWNRWRESKG